MRLKKIIAAILTVIILIGVMPFAAHAAASEWGMGDTLDDALSELRVNFYDTRLDWLMLPNIGVVYQRYTYFLFKNERTGEVEEHPVYCVDPTKGGAYEVVRDFGSSDDGSDTAVYIRGERVGDARYKAIIAAGYPHQKLTGLNLQTKEEGYYATKLALWMYIRGNDPAKLTINPKYGNDDPVALRVRNAAVNIFNNVGGQSLPEPKLTLTGKPSTTAKLDANGEYFVQEIEVHASSWIGTSSEASGDVQLSWESPPPAGTIVLGSNGEDITLSLSVDMNGISGKMGQYGKVTIKYPASEIDYDTFSPPTLNAKAIVTNDEIYVAYAKVNKDKYQRYLVERDPKIELKAAFVSQIGIEPGEIDYPSDSGLRICKLEAGTNNPLAGAVFEVRDPDGKLICSMATNDSGIIDIPLYIVGNYTVTEVTPPQYHLLPDNRTQSVTVHYGEVTEVTFTNAPYGTLRVVKRDSADGRPLGGAAIRIRNIVTNTTQEGHTDSSGNVIFDKLPVGAYEIVELASPDGYALDSTVHTVNVVSLSEGETSYTLTNKANPGLRITKFDRQTMTAIAGVTFEVWHDGELYGTYVTDAWGEIELRNLPAGTYTAKEVATVAPYVLDTTAQWIELKAGQGYISDLVFFNLAKPGIWLVKVDSETLQPLVNAVYMIKHVGGTFEKEYTTDINGEISLDELEPGAYQVIELQAPAGYLIDDGIRTIQTNPGENAQFVFTNTRKPSLEVVKFDSVNYLPGATFRIAKIEDGSHYLDRVTDTNGKIRIDDLDPGIYSVKELQAPEGYVINDTEFHVELFPGKTSQLVVNNEKKPYMLIVKTDAVTGAPIAGVTFTVRKVDSSTLVTVVTDANGEALIEKLDPGVYQVIEQSVPAGYLIDNTPQLITLVPNRTGVVRFQNYPRPSLEITKTDIHGNPIPGAVFSVTQKSRPLVGDFTTDQNGKIYVYNLSTGYYIITEKSVPIDYILDTTPREEYFTEGKLLSIHIENKRKPDLTILKVDSVTGDPVKGAKFQIWYAENGSLSGNLQDFGYYYSDENGKISLPRRNVGWYRITELASAAGYSIKAPATQDVFLEADTDKTVTFENTPLSALIIKKLDVDTGAPVPDTTFRVRYLSGTSGTGGTVIYEGKTSVNGTIVLTNLKAGTYVIEELRANGDYELAPNIETVYLSGEDQDVVTVTFTNEKKGGLIIRKLDSATNQPLAGAAFLVTDSAGGVIGPNNGIYRTDASGVITIDGILSPGMTVIVRETSAPDGYVLDETPQTVKVQANTTHTLTFYNVPKVGLIIRKLDSATNQPLAGATFQVTDSAGGSIGPNNGIYKTDTSGTITIDEILTPGMTVIIKETAAPDGYVLDETPQTVQVKANTLHTLTFYNVPKVGLIIRKLDSATNQPLAGTTFQVTDSAGGSIGPNNGIYNTDTSGTITIDEILTPGMTVIVKETAAPDGYVLDKTPQTVQVKANTLHTLTFYNVPKVGLIIRKLDSATKQPLAGATFQVTDSAGGSIGPNNGIYKTDTSGTINIDEILTPGMTVIVKETAAPDGYVLDETPQTVKVQANTTHTLTFYNTPKVGLIIRKLDSATKQPLAGATFQVTDSAGGVIGPNNGIYKTDASGTISIGEILTSGITVIVRETSAPNGYVLDETQQTVQIKANTTHTLTFYNTKKGGFQIIKLDEDTRQPIAGVEFSIAKMNGEHMGTYRTDANGIIYLSGFTSGWYTIVETKQAKGYKLDTEPRNFEIKEGETGSVTITNQKQASILIHKVDSVTGKGIYGVTFLLYDSGNNPIGQFQSDQDGYVWINAELAPGKYLLRELKAADGYILDEQLKTVYIEGGRTTEIRWENTPIYGQIQIFKRSADDNPQNGIPAGTLLSGAVFEIVDKAGNVVDTVTTGNDGRAVSKPLPLARYFVREIKAPANYSLNGTVYEAEIEFEGQIVKVEVTNKSVSLGVSVKKRGYNEAVPGQQIRYDFSGIGNTSSVPLASFYWRDTLPVDAVRLNKIVTGSWNQALSYKVMYKTNTLGDYKVLADNLSSQKVHVLDASPAALRLASNEYVTEIMFVFGQVKAGFAQLEAPYIFCDVLPGLAHEYRFVNQTDVGGTHNGEWVMANDRWVTIIYNKQSAPKLPRTGY